MSKLQITELNGTWSMQRADGEMCCPVQIPGSVLSGLLENGLIGDPYYRMREYETRELLRSDFTFRRQFTIERSDSYTYQLVCEGIDTIAEIFLNGVLLQKTENMHRCYRIPCGSQLVNGENLLEVRLHSPITYIEEYTPQPGKEITYTACGAMTGNQYIRKAHSMFGWDWGPQLPDMGIWRDIYICGYETARIADVRIRQQHNEDGTVRLEADTGLEMAEAPGQSGEAMEMRLELITPDGERLSFVDNVCLVEHPRLWWPNRYGEQPLYTVNATLYRDDEVLDQKTFRIGLRTLTVSQREDAWGREFAFCVNGIRIFARGANYIPEDCIYSTITPNRIEALLNIAVECGFNCIRVWGGGYYPSDAFYDYCDEKGLIVWQDFMYACNIYELTEQFRENVIAETRDNAVRLRNHACLGLWCGNNEMESAWDHWGGFCDHPAALRQDYLTMFEKIIPETLREVDDATFYWPSSPSSGGGIKEPDSDDVGDRHYWDVWHGEKPFSDYENYYFRFCSEFGFQSFPCAKTIAGFTLPDDRNIFSEVMESHQKNGSANAKILHYIAENFLYPKDFESLIYISQVLQGIAIKSGVEHWRRHRGRCMGAIYWQLNDNWPVASWSSVDYYGRWKALQYMARHFYADILGSLQVRGAEYTPFIQNETRGTSESVVTLWVKNMDGTVLYEEKQQITCEALSVAAGSPVELEDVLRGRESDVFVEALFRHSDGTMGRQVEVPKPWKHMQIRKTRVDSDAVREGNRLSVTLTSPVPAFFVEAEAEDADIVWSDNFMHLTGDGKTVIEGTLPEDYEGIPALRVRSLCDAY